MRHEFTLQPVARSGTPLVFAWDDSTGELSGQSAQEVRDLVAHALRDGYVIAAPYPTSYDVTDPLHNIAEMAAMLSQFWCLDALLGDALAQIVPDDEEVIPGLRY